MNKKNYQINWKIRFKITVSTNLSKITVNPNEVNAQIKKHRVAK